MLIIAELYFSIVPYHVARIIWSVQSENKTPFKTKLWAIGCWVHSRYLNAKTINRSPIESLPSRINPIIAHLETDCSFESVPILFSLYPYMSIDFFFNLCGYKVNVQLMGRCQKTQNTEINSGITFFFFYWLVALLWGPRISTANQLTYWTTLLHVLNLQQLPPTALFPSRPWNTISNGILFSWLCIESQRPSFIKE